MGLIGNSVNSSQSENPVHIITCLVPGQSVPGSGPFLTTFQTISIPASRSGGISGSYGTCYANKYISRT